MGPEFLSGTLYQEARMPPICGMPKRWQSGSKVSGSEPLLE
jgi:hypothetical protein